MRTSIKLFLSAGALAVLLSGAAFAGGQPENPPAPPAAPGPGFLGAPGMMGPGRGWHHGGFGPGFNNQGPITERIGADKAKQAVAAFLKNQGDEFEVGEIMEFDFNFYAAIKEKASGKGAFELLIDPYRGWVSPEPGPNMMWNSKYGHMRWGYGQGPMGVTPDKAKELAQNYLNGFGPGFKAEEVDEFYGYYTVEFEKDGKTAGMLSVNGAGGQVWYHGWHGAYRATIK